MRIKNITSSVGSFRGVKFNPDFSVVLGVARTKGEGKDHNLGKTLLIKIIEHILFGTRDSDRILKLKAAFDNPSFTLEIETLEGPKTITADYSKKRSAAFSKEVRDDYEYYIRYQDEFGREFQKTETRVKDKAWKPLLLELMGFDKSKLLDKYEIEESIAGYKKFIDVATEAGLKKEANKSRITELETQRDAIINSLQSLDLSQPTKLAVQNIADNIDEKLLSLKKRLFTIRRDLSSVESALREDEISQFSTPRIEEIYSSMKVYFGDQIRADLDEVEKFSKQITINRKSGLTSLRTKFRLQIEEIEKELSHLYLVRAERLKAITSQAAIDEYKNLSLQLSEVQSELSVLQQDVYKDSITNATKEMSTLKTQQLKLAAAVAQEIDENDFVFEKIKLEYSSIMKEVMDIDAEIQISKNSTGNLDFKTISWIQDSPSQELDGEMARKISCAAFDIAIRIVHSEDLGFLIHDGVIDNAGLNVKEKFIKAVKSRVKKYGFQYILTAIKDDEIRVFEDRDICITLSDKSPKDLLMGKNY